MSIIIDNFKTAINGKSKAKRKYKLFEEQAKRENLPEIVHLFKAISYAESIYI